MNIFYRPKYLSDTTQFLNELKTRNPALSEQQNQGRALLWGCTLDRETLPGFSASKVRQKPYVYQTDSAS